jgi:asparagine synthase (glutamine-hydrolysing)
VSLFLSGGLDSSAIAWEAVHNGANIKDAYTISISNKDNKLDQQSDDLKYAKVVATQLGINLEIIEAENNMMELLPELSNFLEDGIADPAAINTYLISKSARENGVKVMLSGQGADEYLAGYRRYLAEKLYQKMPTNALKTLSLVKGILPASIPGKFNGNYRRFKKFIDTASLSKVDRLLSLYSWNSSKEITDLFCNSEGLQIAKDHRDEFNKYQNKNILEAMMLVDQKFDLSSLNLAYTDKMSMMVGVEARVPFLDFELIKIMNSIPLHMKLKGNVQKYILKKAMEPRLPKEVIYRQKAGFSLPIRTWMRQSNDLIDHYFDSNRITKQGLFNSQKLNQMLEDQYLGKRDHAYTLFAMLSLQIWLENNSNYH